MAKTKNNISFLFLTKHNHSLHVKPANVFKQMMNRVLRKILFLVNGAILIAAFEDTNDSNPT